MPSNGETNEQTGGGRPRWPVVESDTDATLFDVIHTHTGTFAVGEHGVVLTRQRGESGKGPAAQVSGNHWERLPTAGPVVGGRTLTALEATSSGRRLWYCGSSGALGYYDFDEQASTDCSAPNGMTNQFTAIAVGGQRGEETAVVADDSGQVVQVQPTGDGADLTGPAKPAGAGSEIVGLAATTAITNPGESPMQGWTLYAANSNGDVLYAQDGEWTRVKLDASACKDLTIHEDTAYVVTGEGAGYTVSPDETSAAFSPGGSPEAIAFDGDQPVVAGPDGRIAREREDGWTRESTGADGTFHGLALGDADVAVGENGVVVERLPDAATR